MPAGEKRESLEGQGGDDGDGKCDGNPAGHQQPRERDEEAYEREQA